MARERRLDLIFGILLLLIGGLFLSAQFDLIPGLNAIMNIQYQWPFLVIGVGVLLFLIGLLSHAPDLSIPACIVGGIGGLLYWTNSTGNFASWSYLWTLIPSFVGVGILLSTLLGDQQKNSYRQGFILILISAFLFVIFFMIFSGQGNFIKYWPVLIILAGLWMLIQTIFHRK